MKLFNSHKKSEPANPAQNLYPKVKTFSGSYDYSPAGSGKTESMPAIREEERLYPVASFPVPDSVNAMESDDFRGPELIDLQDTLLTDDSFADRAPKWPAAVLSSAVPPVPDAGPAEQENNEGLPGSETEDSDEPFYIPESEPEDEPAGSAGSLYVPASETEDEADDDAGPFYIPESDPEDEPAGSAESLYASGAETEDEADDDNGAFYVPESEEEEDPSGAAEPFFASGDGGEDETDPEFEPDFGTGYADEPYTGEAGSADEETDPFFIPDPDSEDDSGVPAVSGYETEPLPEESAEGDVPHNEGTDSVSVYTVRLLPKLESAGKTSLTASWQPVADAAGYDLYIARSGESFGGVYRTLSPEETAFTFKDLDKKTVYKMRVRAFELAHGQKTVICESDSVRCITGGSTKKYTNAAKVKIQENTLEIPAGGKGKIVASAVGLEKGMQVLPAHGSELRYLSGDPSVATVSEEGKVRGVTPGSCRLFVIASNGIHSVVDVSVRESVPSVAFRKKKYSVAVGDSLNLKKKLKSKPESKSDPMKWKSSDKEIAEVSKKGIVTALKKGRITVRLKTRDSGCARVKIRIVSAKKTDPVPWDGFSTGKKSSSGKKWSYFA